MNKVELISKTVRDCVSTAVCTVFVVLGLALTGFIGCAGPQMVTLANGRKVPAAPSYVSAAEMKGRGKNSFGVPESSYIYYPRDFKPSKFDLQGHTADDWAAHTQATGIRFRPSNMPSWDHSNADPLDIEHDCFLIEKLFVVPWGLGEDEVGRSLGDDKIKFPAIGYTRAGEILVWDQPRLRQLVFNQKGEVVRIVGNASSCPGLDWDINEIGGWSGNLDELNFLVASGDIGQQSQIFDSQNFYVGWREGKLISADIRKQKVTCRVYLPFQITDALAQQGDFGDGLIQPVLYPEGYLIFPRFTASGLEIYRYSRR